MADETTQKQAEALEALYRKTGRKRLRVKDGTREVLKQVFFEAQEKGLSSADARIFSIGELDAEGLAPTHPAYGMANPAQVYFLCLACNKRASMVFDYAIPENREAINAKKAPKICGKCEGSWRGRKRKQKKQARKATEKQP